MDLQFIFMKTSRRENLLDFLLKQFFVLINKLVLVLRLIKVILADLFENNFFFIIRVHFFVENPEILDF